VHGGWVSVEARGHVHVHVAAPWFVAGLIKPTATALAALRGAGCASVVSDANSQGKHANAAANSRHRLVVSRRRTRRGPWGGCRR
jgi:hypothetical protein